MSELRVRAWQDSECIFIVLEDSAASVSLIEGIIGRIQALCECQSDSSGQLLGKQWYR